QGEAPHGRRPDPYARRGWNSWHHTPTTPPGSSRPPGASTSHIGKFRYGVRYELGGAYRIRPLHQRLVSGRLRTEFYRLIYRSVHPEAQLTEQQLISKTPWISRIVFQKTPRLFGILISGQPVRRKMDRESRPESIRRIHRHDGRFVLSQNW